MTNFASMFATANGRDHPPGAFSLPPFISAADLQTTEFPPVSWVVDGLLPEGLTLFAGKPKLGKSWMSLHLGYAVATGGGFLGRPVTQGTVLYAALEDNNRRLKDRLTRMAPLGDRWPTEFDLCTQWPRLDNGGLDALEGYLDQKPKTRCLILDTLAPVRPTTKAKESQYTGDYAAMSGLHRLANERAVSVLVVHHLRKADADDPFDMVSGSTGLTGAADTTLVLTRKADGCVLYGRGRDLAEFETAVEFDTDACTWSDLGKPSLAFASDTKRAILAAMEQGAGTLVRIADLSGVDYELCKKTLQRMADAGEVKRDGRGVYSLPVDPLSPVSPCPQGKEGGDKGTEGTAPETDAG